MSNGLNPKRSRVKVLAKLDGSSKSDQVAQDGVPEVGFNNYCGADLSHIKHSSEARTFKLIDDRKWNIVAAEPPSETTFFTDGHSAMSIISIIGTKGVGKSSLLNKIAKTEAFQTYRTSPSDSTINVKHITRGVDIYATHYRMLLDCQPFLSSSVLQDFLTSHSRSQFQNTSPMSDPLSSCHMISLQLATFLIATSDYVIIMTDYLIDVHLLKLIASAIMMIGEDNVRAKFILYSTDGKVMDSKIRIILDKTLGKNRIDRYFRDEEELLNYVKPYTDEKCDLYSENPNKFTGKQWLSSCQRLWNVTIKNSSMFSDYALEMYNSNNINL